MGPRKHLLDWGEGWTSPFAAARGDVMAMRPFVKFFYHLLLCIIALRAYYQDARKNSKTSVNLIQF